MNDDYYSLLNVSRSSSEDDIRASFKKLCMQYHPDKHSIDNRDSAETIFRRLRKAHDVLTDPQMRAIYDLYGSEGIESGWHVALYDMDKNTILEKYERMMRQKEEQERERATNPCSETVVKLDARGLITSDHFYSLLDVINIPVNEFAITQSVDAPLTANHKLTLVCSALNREGNGLGKFTVTDFHRLSPRSNLSYSFGFGDGLSGGFHGTFSLTQYLFAAFRTNASLYDDGNLAYDGAVTLGCMPNSFTSLKVEFGDRIIKGVVETSYKKWQMYTSYQLGYDNHIVALHIARPISINDTDDGRIECSFKYNLAEGFELEYGASKQLTDYSKAGAIVRIGMVSGVKLKLMLSRGNHVYRFDIKFSDVLDPVAIVYGTCVPVFVYSALHWLVVKPYLNRFKEEERQRKADEMAEQLQKAKEEARDAIRLMKSNYERILDAENLRGGLIIEQAWYGVFGPSSKLIDVTIPLQCLVLSSKLVLPPAESKSNMVGFYDVAIGEDKQLSVRYKFRNCKHETTINDSDPLRIPKQSHRLN